MIWIIVIVVAVVALILLFLVWMYNRLVRLRNRTQNAWAQVNVQLRRRYDLIPNMVESVKGYAAHERGTFDEVTRARTAAQQAQTVPEQAQAENVLTAAIGRLFAVAEAYPQLRATENFQQLQEQLSDTEQKIAVSRQVYNYTVLTYNNGIQTVPTNIVAGLDRGEARLGHALKRLALVRGVALDRLDQVRHQVVPALELHLDAAPRLVDLVARADQRVVGQHAPQRQQRQCREHDVHGGHTPVIG